MPKSFGAILAADLARGTEDAFEDFREALADHRAGRSGGINPADIGIRDLFEHLVPDGREAIRFLDPRVEFDAMEFAAVNTGLFSKITGQLVFSSIMAAYQSPAYVLTGLIPSESTPFQDGELIPGMTNLSGDDALVVGEGEQYPRAGFTDEYIETPRTTKRGLIVSVTREAVFGDRIGLVLQRASQVGEVFGLQKERRLIDIMIGATNNYKRNGTAVDTYQTASPWINDHSNPLTTFADVDDSEQLFLNMTDPNNGEEIVITGAQYLFSRDRKQIANRIFGASEVRDITGATTTISANPIAGEGNPIFTRLMKGRIVSELGEAAADAAEWWFHGQFDKAFVYKENWPITTVQAPRNSTDEFNRDIVAEYKASEKGVAAVKDPRYVVRNKH